ncbi:MAG: SIMPL domain-containing protein [Treponema sp.]|jgi:hypothetical protein|nr:SIMPL domain-containing protein [Treponema sp.]
MKNISNMLILGISIIIGVSIVSMSLVIIKTKEAGHITVTGSATMSFTSDLIVWRGAFSKKAMTSKEAYEQLKIDTDTVRAYLLNKGVKEDEIVFSSISMDENYEQAYTQDRSFIKRTFTGYTLTQQITIQSSEVDKIAMISRDITELIDRGVEVFSMAPEYYYTQLDTVKIDLIAKAAENARIRAEKIIEQSGGAISTLRTASLGVFQITAENSSAESYSYSGAFDVASKNKTAFITTRLEYNVK